MDNREIEKLKRELADAKQKIDLLHSIILGTNDDKRFQAKVRKTVIIGRTSTGLPIITNDVKRWSITNVTEV